MVTQLADQPIDWFEAAPDAVLGVDRLGRIVAANTRIEPLSGYARDELIGQPVEVLVPAAGALHPAYPDNAAVADRPGVMGDGQELEVYRKDGSHFPATISLAQIGTRNGPVVIAAIRDDTQRRRRRAKREAARAAVKLSERELQSARSQRLESLGQLAAGVAHDFNNLLSVILNCAAFVEDELTAPGRDVGAGWDTALDDLRQVRRAAERAGDLSHQILIFARREAIKPQIFSLNAVVVEVEQLLRRTLEEGIDVITDLAPELWPMLADPGQFEQIIVNLAVNSRYAMQDGGVLRISTANVIVDASTAAEHPGIPPGRYVELRLSDTGTGLPGDAADRAFEPFFTTKPKGDGTGLGLATVRGIVTEADGFAEIWSEPGEGTTFVALIPATSRPAETADEVEGADGATNAPSGREAVLVVEDDEPTLEVTRRVLIRAGYRTITATDGSTALALLRDTDEVIDLLLTDVMLPKMLGREVADQAKVLRPGIRVLFMSGYAEPLLSTRGRLKPNTPVVEKPISGSELLERVRASLDSAPD